MSSSRNNLPDIVIVGAGIIGLSLALELHSRGARVTVLERNAALTHASTAAAGMLAAQDPHNPPQLYELAAFSEAIYMSYLSRIEELARLHVLMQTQTAVQHHADGTTTRLDEFSVDPRQLAAALLAAVRRTSIELREHTAASAVTETSTTVSVQTNSSPVNAASIVFTTGAWPAGVAGTFPRKGQMLRVQLPPSLRGLDEVHRNEHVYVVPRTSGPQAGTALIGATVEDAGFDTTVHPAALAQLRSLAAELLPALASEADAPQVEAWAGLRPCTPDMLPLLGHHTPRQLYATGHYRNGILLAPATAAVLTALLLGQTCSIDLTPFHPNRFQARP